MCSFLLLFTISSYVQNPNQTSTQPQVNLNCDWILYFFQSLPTQPHGTHAKPQQHHPGILLKFWRKNKAVYAKVILDNNGKSSYKTILD